MTYARGFTVYGTKRYSTDAPSPRHMYCIFVTQLTHLHCIHFAPIVAYQPCWLMFIIYHILSLHKDRLILLGWHMVERSQLFPSISTGVKALHLSRVDLLLRKCRLCDFVISSRQLQCIDITHTNHDAILGHIAVFVKYFIVGLCIVCI